MAGDGVETPLTKFQPAILAPGVRSRPRRRFERQLRRMAGLDDGIVDGLLQFTRAVSGGSYWCPPTRDDRLDLSALECQRDVRTA